MAMHFQTVWKGKARVYWPIRPTLFCKTARRSDQYSNEGYNSIESTANEIFELKLDYIHIIDQLEFVSIVRTPDLTPNFDSIGLYHQIPNYHLIHQIKFKQ